ncbi:MAG: hypothetical protein GQ477_00735 [Nanohaloarchaea archaeon]|nr:hypothetical protein [Candidatus Nanohaloarchaea archaeon]
MVLMNNVIPKPVTEELSEKEKFENEFLSYTGWVFDARNKSILLGDDKKDAYIPILDKFLKGMHRATTALYESIDEVPSQPYEIDSVDFYLKKATETFCWNKYFDLEYIKKDLKHKKISDLDGANLLADAFDEFKDLKADERDYMMTLADSVLTGVHEATKIVCFYDGEEKDEYIGILNDLVKNMFGFDKKVRVD